MKIIGHPWIESERFVVVESVEAIRQSPAASVLLFESLETSLEIIEWCRKEHLPWALQTEETRAVLLAQAMGARYLVTTQERAVPFQELAQHYLFDMEILAVIEEESQIEACAERRIDGVLFAEAIEREGRASDAR
jgi:hypothetical protein